MNLLYREYVNGALLILNISIIIIISHQLYVSRSLHGHGWSKKPGVASACAMWWVFVAEAIRSWLAWSALHLQSSNNNYANWDQSHSRAWLWILAGILASAGTARLIYTLSPPKYGHRAWISAISVMLIFLFMVWIGLIDFINRTVFKLF